MHSLPPKWWLSPNIIGRCAKRIRISGLSACICSASMTSQFRVPPQICPRASWPCKATTRPASTDPNFRSTHLPICEAFDFSSLKKERIKKKIYRTRELAQAEISDYIESFYNPTRRHSHLGGVSPEEFERAGRRRRRVH